MNINICQAYFQSHIDRPIQNTLFDITRLLSDMFNSDEDDKALKCVFQWADTRHT